MTVAGVADARPGLSVDVGNPHVVLALPGRGRAGSRGPHAGARRAPRCRRNGTNVELVVPLGEDRAADGTLVGRVRMRVHERGVGETRSCGTGACAAALAVRSWAGAGAPDVWLVDVPGGTVRVTVLPERQRRAGRPCSARRDGGRGPVGTAMRLTPDELGAALGERATIVQFSSTFCAPCRATRHVVDRAVATTRRRGARRPGRRRPHRARRAARHRRDPDRPRPRRHG